MGWEIQKREEGNQVRRRWQRKRQLDALLFELKFEEIELDLEVVGDWKG